MFCRPGTRPLPHSLPRRLLSGAGERCARKRRCLQCWGPGLQGQAHLYRDRAGDIHGPQCLPVSLALGPSRTAPWGGRALLVSGACAVGLACGQLLYIPAICPGQGCRTASASRWAPEPKGQGVRLRPRGREELGGPVGRRAAWQNWPGPGRPAHACSLHPWISKVPDGALGPVGSQGNLAQVGSPWAGVSLRPGSPNS